MTGADTVTGGFNSPVDDPLTSALVDGRYEVLAQLGQGGMGTVYKVRHLTLQRLFAMKVLRRELAKDSGLAARFEQEARATAAIRHPAVVAINDFGNLDDGTPYFVMELLVGETLAAHLGARGRLSPREAAFIGAKIAHGLSAAHEAGVVHRDLKPENVFLVGAAAGRLAAADDVRIVDFGAAKIIGGSALTRPGVVFGTPYYMSPEQASGQPVDARSDVYSMGVLLYEMVTGRLPFDADTYMGVLSKHMFVPPPRPSEVVDVPLGALEEIVLRALEKEPRARQASMTELAVALERSMVEVAPPPAPASARTRRLGQLPGAASGLGVASQASAADRIESSVARQLAREAQRELRLRALAALGVLAALSAVVLLVVLLGGRSEEPSHAVTAMTAVSAPVASVVPSTVASGAVNGTVAPEATMARGATASTVEAPAATDASRSRPVVSAAIRNAGPEDNSAGPRPAPRAKPPPSAGTVPVEDFPDPWKR